MQRKYQKIVHRKKNEQKYKKQKGYKIEKWAEMIEKKMEKDNWERVKAEKKRERERGWLVVWVLWHINQVIHAKSIFIQIISSISNKSA